MFLSISFNNFVMCYLLHGFSTVCLLIDDFPECEKKLRVCSAVNDSYSISED